MKERTGVPPSNRLSSVLVHEVSNHNHRRKASRERETQGITEARAKCACMKINLDTGCGDELTRVW